MTSVLSRSGIYEPVLTNVQNADSSSVPYDGTAFWSRIGDVVTVSGVVSVTPSIGLGVNVEVDMGLPFPVASGQSGRIAGVGSIVTSSGSAPVRIYKSGQRARIRFNSLNVGAVDISFTLSYLAG